MIFAAVLLLLVTADPVVSLRLMRSSLKMQLSAAELAKQVDDIATIKGSLQDYISHPAD